MNLEEAMRHQRAHRELSTEPVDDEILLRLTDLAIRAPSGRNSQAWDFVFVKDPEKIAAIGRLNRTFSRLYRLFTGQKTPKNHMERTFLHQADHFDSVPVVAVVCWRGWYLPGPLVFSASYFGSVFPAVQNLLLAAQAEGLGTTLTTCALWNSFGISRILELPWGVTPCVIIPMGWPSKKLGPNRRKPAEEFFHRDTYGNRPFLRSSESNSE